MFLPYITFTEIKQDRIVQQLLLALSLIFLANTVAWAEDVKYVTDEFEITLRDGKGTPNKILKIIPTGAKVEILEEDAEGGYSRVRFNGDTEGWVLTRYLISQPIAKIRLQSAQQKIEKMKTTISELENEVNALRTSKASLEKENLALGKSTERLGKDLEAVRKVSAKPLALNDENEELKSQLLTLRRDMASLEQNNSTLQDQSAKNWFMIGAAVCVLGIIVGLLLPNLRMRKKASWSSL